MTMKLYDMWRDLKRWATDREDLELLDEMERLEYEYE